jgi:hypothetical protein
MKLVVHFGHVTLTGTGAISASEAESESLTTTLAFLGALASSFDLAILTACFDAIFESMLLSESDDTSTWGLLLDLTDGAIIT